MIRPAAVVAPIDDTLRGVVVGFRVVATLWLGALAATTLADDPGANRAVVAATCLLATLWTLVTVTPIIRRGRLGSAAWVAADGVVALFVSISPYIAGSRDLFFGGYPLSWLLLVAYAAGLWPVLAASVALAAGQVIGSLGRAGHTMTNTVGDIAVFVVSALVFGWAIGLLRRNDHLRTEALQALEDERQQRVRADDRAEIAAHLHDAVLQTLALIQQNAGDPRRVTALAHGQERDLRRWIDRIASPFVNSFRAALRSTAAEVEDAFQIEIDTVVVGDCEVDEGLEALLQAARESLVNAARHSGDTRASLYAEVSPTEIVVTVRDRGRGFDPTAVSPERRGLAHSVAGRMERHGGRAFVTSEPGRGTEIELRMGSHHD
jgi:signal transduction histidine kinase